MTLLIGVLTDSFACIASDRRLTSGNAVVTDESNKALIAASWDSRLAMALTGLAAFGGTRTELVLVDAFDEVASGRRVGVDGVLEKFSRLVDAKLPTSVAPADRRLTVLVVGFQYDGAGNSRPRAWRISNFQDPDGSARPLAGAMAVTGLANDAERPRVMLAGYDRVVSAGDVDALTGLASSAPPAGVEKKLIDIMQTSSIDARSRGLIGAQTTVCTVPCERNTKMMGQYYSAVPTQTMHGAAVVFAVGDECAGMKGYDMAVTNSDELGPFALPKVGRNQPCPCGSGQNFKRCHLHIGASRWGPIAQCGWTDGEEAPSGRNFLAHFTAIGFR